MIEDTTPPPYPLVRDDPYWAWELATRFRYTRDDDDEPPVPLSLLIELRNESSADAMAAELKPWLDLADHWQGSDDRFLVVQSDSERWQQLLEEPQFGQHVAAWQLGNVVAPAGSSTAEAIRPASTAPLRAANDDEPPERLLHGGVIDGGLDPTLAGFTRRAGQLAISVNPDAVSLGSAGGRWQRPLVLPAHRHGTAVAGAIVKELLSLQDRRPIPQPAEIQLQFAEVPERQRAFWDTSGRWLNTLVIDAPWRLRQWAMRDHARALVVNVSLGNNAGPHDGSSLVERAIDDAIVRQPDRPLHVLIAAGNARQDDLHSALSIPSGDTHQLDWRILPDDATPNFLELWLDDTADLAIELESPAGETVSVRPGREAALRDGSHQISAWLSWRPAKSTANGNGAMLLLAIAPARRAPGVIGDWTIHLTNKGSESTRVNAWIQRDDRISHRHWQSRQSHFVKTLRWHEDNAPFPSSPPGLHSTVNGIANGRHSLTIAAHRRQDGVVPGYSDQGPAIDYAAPGAESVTRPSIPTIGTRDGAHGRISGTSAATATASARLLFELCHEGTSADAKHLLGAAAAKDEDAMNGQWRAPKRAETRIGNGRLVNR